MEIAYLILAFTALAALAGGLWYLLGRTPRNDDSTHGDGFSGDATGGSYGGPD